MHLQLLRMKNSLSSFLWADDNEFGVKTVSNAHEEESLLCFVTKGTNVT